MSILAVALRGSIDERSDLLALSQSHGQPLASMPSFARCATAASSSISSARGQRDFRAHLAERFGDLQCRGRASRR
jgi:hypothetical protein